MRIPGQLLYQGFRRGLRNPKVRPWIILGIIAYLLSPIDVVPSFLIGFGEIDDLVLVGLLVTELLQIWVFEPAVMDPAYVKPETTSQTPQGDTVIDVEAKPID